MVVSNRIAEYFVVVGVGSNPQRVPLDSENAPKTSPLPIVEIGIINASQGEEVPLNFEKMSLTPTGLSANLNHGSVKCDELFLCIRRGLDIPPISDVGVLYEGKETPMKGVEVIYETFQGKSANVNNTFIGNQRIFITFRRSVSDLSSNNILAVTDICIIITSKGENPPHSYSRIDKNLNKGLLGSDVYMCYKKTYISSNRIKCVPKLISRYPEPINTEFPERIPSFCFPLGAFIEVTPLIIRNADSKTFSTFVLKVGSGLKLYGAALTFYESLSLNQVPEEFLLEFSNFSARDWGIFAPKCICLLSRFPFFDVMRAFLFILYKQTFFANTNVSVERYLSHFFFETPMLSPVNSRIFIQYDDPILAVIHDEQLFCHSAASFVDFLLCLGTDGAIDVFLSVLLEAKLLVHSLRASVITGVVEAISNLMFPLQWQCAYVPVCPLDFSDVLDAPLPFIVGIDSQYFDIFDPPPDVICVDLDTNTFKWPENKVLVATKMLPKKALKSLRMLLSDLYIKIKAMKSRANRKKMGKNYILHAQQPTLEYAVREAFLKFMLSVLHNYQAYLKPIIRKPNFRTTDACSLFDFDGFLRSRDAGCQKFYSLLCKTQAFSRFIEERSLAPDNFRYAFFDNCFSKFEDSDNPFDATNLLNIEPVLFNNNKTVVVLPPDPDLSSIGKHETREKFELNFNRLNAHTQIFENVATNSDLLNVTVTRRSKFDKLQDQMTLQELYQTPVGRATSLLVYAYYLWFLYLPAYASCPQFSAGALDYGYKIIVQMFRQNIMQPDEQCFRIFMQLCQLFDRPTLAVKTWLLLKTFRFNCDAVTYGYYNKAVLEGTWPSKDRWAKIRSVFRAISAFKDISSGQKYDESNTDNALSDGQSLCSYEESSMQSIFSYFQIPASNFSAHGIFDSKKALDLRSDKGYSSLSPEDNLNNNRISVDLSWSLEKSRSNTVSSPSMSFPLIEIFSYELVGIIMTSARPSEEEIGFLSYSLNNSTSVWENETSRSEQICMCKCKSALVKQQWELVSQVETQGDPLSENLRFESPSKPSVAIDESAFTPFRTSTSTSTTSAVQPPRTSQNKLSKNIESPSHVLHGAYDSAAFIFSNYAFHHLCSNDRLVPNIRGSSSSIWTTNSTNSRNIDSKFNKGENEIAKQCIFPWESPTEENDITADITSCSRCPSCYSLLYDEEIMSEWSYNDSVMYILCPYCSFKFVPSLTIRIKERNSNKTRIEETSGLPSAHLMESNRNQCRCLKTFAEDVMNLSEKKCFAVHYLSPIVLRKEVEYVLELEGETALFTSKLLHEHPTLYWNLVWIFYRLKAETHLPFFLLGRELNENFKKSEGPSIRCFWHVPYFNGIYGLPYYQLWEKLGAVPPLYKAMMLEHRSFLNEKVLQAVSSKNIFLAVQILISDREFIDPKMKKQLLTVYRELLFAYLKIFGCSHRNVENFDREFAACAKKFSVQEACDILGLQPQQSSCLLYRNLFVPLSF